MKACKVGNQEFRSAQAAAIHLMYNTDKTYTEIANDVGIRPQTVIQAQKQEIRRLEREVYA